MFRSRLFLVAGGVLALGACSGSTPTAEPAPVSAAQSTTRNETAKTPKSCSRCAEGKAGKTVWCDHCGKGYVDGKSVGCKGCWDGKSKTAAHAWCNNCGMGHVDGKPVTCKKCYDHKASDGPACDVDHSKPTTPSGLGHPPHKDHGHGHDKASDSKTDH